VDDLGSFLFFILAKKFLTLGKNENNFKCFMFRAFINAFIFFPRFFYFNFLLVKNKTLALFVKLQNSIQ
jgi:hypothetical protein